MARVTAAARDLSWRRVRIGTRLGRLAVWRAGSGPAVVLWHSMFVDSSSWRAVAHELASTRTVYLVDGPGFGGSEPLRRRSSIDECSLAAIELLDGLGLEHPVDWIGNAWGGHIGMHVAATSRRIGRLVTISAPVLPGGRRAALIVLNALLRVVGPIPALLAPIVGLQLTSASQAMPERVDAVTRAVHAADRRSLSLASTSFVLDRRDVTAELDQIEAPTLFVATTERPDWTPADARAAAARTPHGSVAVISGARTLVPVEQPRALLEAIHRFWSTTTPLTTKGALSWRS